MNAQTLALIIHFAVLWLYGLYVIMRPARKALAVIRRDSRR